jgi:hypothetical protein
LFDTGHFVLEDKADEVVPLIRDFLKRVIRFGLDAAPVANIAHEFRDGCGASLFCSRDEHIDKSLIRAHETRTLKLMYLVHPGKASGPASNHALRTHRL